MKSPSCASRPLNRFFKMAVMGGVESSVQLHLSRGDDLDARDESGRTPLMIAAARDHVKICKLLLEAGADASLLDSANRDALSIAEAAGATSAAATIATWISTSSERAGRSDVRSPTIAGYGPPSADSAAGWTHRSLLESPMTGHDETALLSGINLYEWDADMIGPPPESDTAITDAAVAVHEAITEHVHTDDSSNWSDLQILLPAIAVPTPSLGNSETRPDGRRIAVRKPRKDRARGADKASSIAPDPPKKPATPTGPRHSKLGYRWNCYKCTGKFFDLGKLVPQCPKCGADQRDRPPQDTPAS